MVTSGAEPVALSGFGILSARSGANQLSHLVEGVFKSNRRSKLSNSPPGLWFVSKCHLVHADTCTSSPHSEARQLGMMPGFHAAELEGHDSSRKRYTEVFRKIDGIDVDSTPAKVYRAIKSTTKEKRSRDSDSNEYAKLVSWLRVFVDQNADSRVCCQLENMDRFYRCFICVGSFAQTSELHIPVFQCDGAHMKCAYYNGVLLTLVQLDGNGQNVPIALGSVHKETTDNFVWFFTNCIIAGLQLQRYALFTDRGRQLNAQQLLESCGITVLCVAYSIQSLGSIQAE